MPGVSQEVRLEKDHLPEDPAPSLVGRFLRRLSWRRRVGPVSTEAHLEVRELDPAPEPPPPGGPGERQA